MQLFRYGEIKFKRIQNRHSRTEHWRRKIDKKLRIPSHATGTGGEFCKSIPSEQQQLQQCPISTTELKQPLTRTVWQHTASELILKNTHIQAGRRSGKKKKGRKVGTVFWKCFFLRTTMACWFFTEDKTISLSITSSSLSLQRIGREVGFVFVGIAFVPRCARILHKCLSQLPSLAEYRSISRLLSEPQGHCPYDFFVHFYRTKFSFFILTAIRERHLTTVLQGPIQHTVPNHLATRFDKNTNTHKHD